MKLYTSNKIYISESKINKAGQGVFAAQDIKKDEIIEVCPVIIVPNKDVSNLKKSILINYYFYFGEKNELLAIALGFGSIYNHSYEPNATYKKKTKEKVIDFIAIKDIKKNEEITTNYNYGNSEDKTTIWDKSIPAFSRESD